MAFRTPTSGWKTHSSLLLCEGFYHCFYWASLILWSSWASVRSSNLFEDDRHSWRCSHLQDKGGPIKRLTILRLELCGAYLLAQLLHHVQHVFELPLSSVYAWTDSTIVLSWLVGNRRRFKTYMGNRVSYIVDLIGPQRWNHVIGVENPADCASRGLFPSELLVHTFWWKLAETDSVTSQWNDWGSHNSHYSSNQSTC